MSFDDRIRETLERTTAGLKTQLERDLTAFSDELRRAAIEERDRAAAEEADAIARAVQSQVTEIRHALQAQVDEARRAAEAEAEQARQTAQVEIDAVRRAADAQIGEAQRRAEQQLENAHRALEQRIADVQQRAGVDLESARAEAAAARAEADQLRAEVAASRADAESARADAAAARDALGRAESELAAARSDLDRAKTELAATAAAAEQAALTAAARGAEKKVQEAAPLLEALRAVDSTHGLGDTLDALADRAAQYAERTALLVVKGNRLRGRRLVGFPGQNPVPRVDVDLDAAGIAGAVVKEGVTVSWPLVNAPGEGVVPAAGLPSFAETAAPRDAVALPLVVDGQVVAVLYADAPPAETPQATEWPAALEVLALHASRTLEVITVRLATGFSRPARPAAGEAASGPRMAGATAQAAAGDDDAARRYARLLVSEIRMYHEPLVDEGRRARDLRARLGGEIDRARRLYEARVPPALRERSDYFEQELVRTLADGDRSLLG